LADEEGQVVSIEIAPGPYRPPGTDPDQANGPSSEPREDAGDPAGQAVWVPRDPGRYKSGGNM
jgi:hypothetical protein